MEEAAVVVWMIIFTAQVRPAAQTVISNAQLLGHSGLCGLPSWSTVRDGKTESLKIKRILAITNS